MDGKVTGRSIAYAAVMVHFPFLLVTCNLQLKYSFYLTSQMRRSGLKCMAVSVSLVSTTLLSTTSKRKVMPLQSSILKNCLHGGISEYLAHIESCSCYSDRSLIISQVFPHHAVAAIDSNDSRNKLKAQRARAAAEMPN